VLWNNGVSSLTFSIFEISSKYAGKSIGGHYPFRFCNFEYFSHDTAQVYNWNVKGPFVGLSKIVCALLSFH